MPTTRLLIEYDGTEYSGWARQAGLRTIQQEIETALATISRQPHTLTVAGRTDAGVHARAQVASYTGMPVATIALNSLLPADIAIVRSEEAHEGFDARRDALSRTYCYRLLVRRERSALDRRFATHWYYPFDRAVLDACAQAITGTHDFTAFTPTETKHKLFQRTIYEARWEGGETGMLEFWIRGKTFMRQQNRVLVGTMLQVAIGNRSFENFEQLLKGAPREDAGPTAPARGLHLHSVEYDHS
jgi:tRNA pseudouridine38-40 synthase